MKTRFIILLLAILTTNAFSQKAPERIITKFFKTYTKNKPDKAINKLCAYSPWLDSKDDELIQLKSQLRDMKKTIGKCNGYSLLTKKTLGDCYELYSYIVKFDNQPIRFTFKFYKPKNKWLAYSFAYDNNLDDDLEKASRIEVLKISE